MELEEEQNNRDNQPNIQQNNPGHGSSSSDINSFGEELLENIEQAMNVC